ncbi:MAG: hypothetical protein ACLFUU_11415 [Desulfobacteraceae bacterium]
MRKECDSIAAEETINMFSLAIRVALTVDDLKEAAAVWAYPTYISDIEYMLG